MNTLVIPGRFFIIHFTLYIHVQHSYGTYESIPLTLAWVDGRLD
jgi:hypothetical protein